MSFSLCRIGATRALTRSHHFNRPKPDRNDKNLIKSRIQFCFTSRFLLCCSRIRDSKEIANPGSVNSKSSPVLGLELSTIQSLRPKTGLDLRFSDFRFASGNRKIARKTSNRTRFFARNFPIWPVGGPAQIGNRKTLFFGNPIWDQIGKHVHVIYRFPICKVWGANGIIPRSVDPR